MPQKIHQCFYDREEDEGDNAHGYHRLENTDESSSAHDKPVNSDKRSASRSRTGKKHGVYTEADAKGKRLSKKLRRKEVRKRIGHALHSTLKWIKRGAIAAAPSMAAMFFFSPAPVFGYATSTSRH